MPAILVIRQPHNLSVGLTSPAATMRMTRTPVSSIIGRSESLVERLPLIQPGEAAPKCRFWQFDLLGSESIRANHAEAMSERIKVTTGPNEVTFTYEEDPHRKGARFIIRVRTARNAHINAPVHLVDLKALHGWLTKRIAETDKPKDEDPENQLDMFPL